MNNNEFFNKFTKWIKEECVEINPSSLKAFDEANKYIIGQDLRNKTNSWFIFDCTIGENWLWVYDEDAATCFVETLLIPSWKEVKEERL